MQSCVLLSMGLSVPPLGACSLASLLSRSRGTAGVFTQFRFFFTFVFLRTPRPPCADSILCRQIPPYDAARGRKCSYFRVDTTASGPQSETARRAAGAGAALADRGGSRNNAGRSGKAIPEEHGGRVILEEIPEPAGLPQWARYRGPGVTLR